MQSHKHTVGDIEEATGLSRRYIDKAYSQLSDVLKPHRIKGDYNRVLYDDSALVIFQRVAQLRAEEKHLPEISGIINGEYESASKPGGETHANPVVKRESDGQASLDEFQLLEELKAAHRREVLAVEQSKREALGLKDQVIETVRDQMKMLTEGKTPEQFRAEQAQQEIERQRERQELERLRSQEEERDAELERTSL